MTKYKIRRKITLKLKPDNARALQRSIACMPAMEADGDEALRRMKAETGPIEACLRAAQQMYPVRLPADGDEARILKLARNLLKGGEVCLDRESLLEGIAAFDAVNALQMQEIQLMPDVLNIALCEALSELAQELCTAAMQRRRAAKWVYGKRERACPRNSGAEFLVSALQLCAEAEKPNLHAQLVRCISRHGDREDLLLERMHRRAADRCLRLENLMHLRHLLAELDWELCFQQLSAAEHELAADPAQVYTAMDAPSKARVRECTAELARSLHMEETAVAGYAMHTAQEALQVHGAQDPRATVCWYLAEDEGRDALCRMLGMKNRLRRCVPDACGKKTVYIVSVLTLVLLAAMLWAVDNLWLTIYLLPLAWVAGQQLIARFYPHWIKPGRILKLKPEALPRDLYTLVVFPVLLSSEARTREMIDHLRAISCLETVQHVDYLLLGDFRDAEAETLPEDAAILSAARTGIRDLNGQANGHRYFYLQRGRSYRARDERWMGENRKRGALMALNRLLLGRSAAEEAFSAENTCAMELKDKYRYVVTLDADTEYLPGTIGKLVGAMHHPLNRRCSIGGCRRGYAVLQPCMQLTADACVNEYVRLSAGTGGVDSYPVSVSDFYQDFTGNGCFAGKGIYDVRAFAEATDGCLQDDAILSHDLIEGILAGAGFLNDICFYDGCPDNLHAEQMRLHRWTRGDWQLLPLLFSKLEISAVDRMKLLSNLLCSLHAPALLGLFIHAVWLDAPAGFILGLTLAFLDAVLAPRHCAYQLRRSLLRLALLPVDASCRLDAVLRTLWRLRVSRKHLMDWVPAADARGNGERSRLPGRIAALLLLPGLLRPFWVPAVLALAALFWLGACWADDLARMTVDACPAPGDDDRALLEDLARKTWAFFEVHVPSPGCGLPPDNVQLDPPVGAAMRTSPTNIGLYLMSCICARELGFLDREAMFSRIADCVSTLEKLEKWQGQLYNWYDIHTLQPLRPRYVSAVDSGNLAGALLLCAEAVDQDQLCVRLNALARGMDFTALYDERRDLFFIGMDAESGCMSQSHYDLYASEARILSYSAMMLGQVPVKHWQRLSRAEVRLGGRQTLASWSGTMFEYLMPELLMHSFPETLAGRMRRGVVGCQMDFAKRLERPWGVSESAYHAFDLQLNYQYRAFGLRGLALSGNAAQDVVAPYAAALALAENPAAAAENLRRMCQLGWCGELGMYEAADYMHGDGKSRPRIVRSHMAHHQGMTLCALCNALRGNLLPKVFMRIPEARALRLLLQEKPGARLRLDRGAVQGASAWNPRHAVMDFCRGGRREGCAADTHLLHGSKTTALVTARGGAYVWNDGWQLNRFFGDLRTSHQGMYVHLADLQNRKYACVGDAGRVLFDAGSALYSQRFSGLDVEMQLCVSPEDGTFYQNIRLCNPGEIERSIDVTGCLAVALSPEKAMHAHAVFQNMFVESKYIGDGVLIFNRRRREPGEAFPQLVYTVSGEGARFETDLNVLLGRSGCLGRAGGIAQELSGKCGKTLNPCAALKRRAKVPAGGEARLHFALALAPEQEAECLANKLCAADAPERAARLAGGQMRAMLGYAGIDNVLFGLLQRSAALIFDPMLRRPLMTENHAQPAVARDDFWRAGISGDLPILLLEAEDSSEADAVRRALRVHGFYRMMGIPMDFVLVCGHGSDYLQPSRAAFGNIVAASHLGGSILKPGGAYLLERQNLDDASLAAIRRGAALRFASGEDVLRALRAQLEGLYLHTQEGGRPMRAGKIVMPGELQFFNGYGGFDGDAYTILLQDGQLPPAPWCNVLASEHAGAVVSERGGGFAWFGSSRFGRLTPFANDALREGWGWMLYLIDESDGSWMRLLPGDAPMSEFCVQHAPGVSRWRTAAEGIYAEVEICAVDEGVRFDVTLENGGAGTRHLRLTGLVNWLMGTDAADAALLRSWSRYGACFATGSVGGVGCFLSDDPRARPGCNLHSFLGGGDMMQPGGMDSLDRGGGGWILHLPMSLRPREMRRSRFLLGCAEDVPAAYELARTFRSGASLRRSREDWPARLEKLKIETPDPALNRILGGFLQAQVLNARIRARTGLYQPGGAWGFRDQLQDMLPMIHYEPERVRSHLLYCAARQFEAGDVLHWWHEPCTGVRTKISDDLLFLPYVTAQYVRITGDTAVLQEHVTFLQDVEIPQGQEDIYAEMQPSRQSASLHEHCMRALRRAAETGEHGLCRMGSGDWNDGMNRVGEQGKGESIWLTEFLAVCAAEYACVAPPEDGAWLAALNERLCAAIEEHGWDGAWYLRAYCDSGEKLGSSEAACCRIDAISQAWAVFAGLDADRCRSAMDAAWKLLADEELSVIRLLTPPFSGEGMDPGYIAAYPAGVRENGAQYTHAACWLLIALVEMGDAVRAHRALQMLLPVNHARSREDADRYRTEPYVMAADIYTEGELAGRGGWSWYTGSAAWMLMAVLRLLGYERRGNCVRLNALLNDWPQVSVTLRFGKSSYRLVCSAEAEHAELDGNPLAGDCVAMIDDGRMHTAVFPPRTADGR